MGDRYWLLAEQDLRDMLKEAKHGEDIGIILAMAYANANSREDFGGEG